MRTKTALVAVFAVALTTLANAAMAETAKQKALDAGADMLDAEAIAETLVGKTVTFEAGDKAFLVYYGEDNNIAGKLVGGGWSDTGIYGITNNDMVCLSWNKSDKGRLRCMYVLDVNGTMRKFNPDGSVNGDLAEIVDGKAF